MSVKVNLSEYLYPEMDLLFVALNAPVNSNNNGHWFTNNLSFWNLLYRVGIITTPISNKLEGDEMVFGGTSINHKNWKIGVTDLIRTIVETDSTKVEPQPEDVRRILSILKNNKVCSLCLLHSKVGEAFRKYSGITFNQNRYGKIGTYGNTAIYEVPFHNAAVPNKDSYYSELIGIKAEKTQEICDKSLKRIPEKNKAPSTKSEKSFVIPKPGNSITKKDIDKGQLRITVDFKDYFPNQCSIINIKYLGKNYSVNYIHKDGRSSILRVGKNFFDKMRVRPETQLKVSMQDGKYTFQPCL
ncbi:hypothetical protein GCM10007103_03440 [Salinimicrobium marinum]|uniref:Uncharacterized protein n=1 Tax=Salinimicrobium marinum TaxID=680283 RepID=A0A918VUY3_9FLAO|nr:hypothetical protein [Salinimicrobium marinum]GHA25520.1 hypothetical protein GCM10007103_03440 [Salinimicrobium marinum]